MLTIEDTKGAYIKLKKYVYNDNTLYHLKNKIADFEYDNIEIKLKSITDEINKYIEEDKSETIEEYISNIKYTAMIKKRIKEQKDIEIVLDTYDDDKVEVEVNYFIDAEIELHIISVLWIMKFGKIFEDDCKSYANKLHSSYENKNSKNIFIPYYVQYQKWRDNALKATKELIRNKKNAIMFSMDISKYYYNANVNFEKVTEIISLKYNNKYTKLTKIIEKIYEKYSKELSNEIENIGDRIILPIGILTSNILANWTLREFDTKVYQKLKPVYYGRYVDDILIVLKNDFPKLTKTDEIMKSFFIEKELIYINSDEETKYFLKGINNEELFIQQEKLRIMKFVVVKQFCNTTT